MRRTVAITRQVLGSSARNSEAGFCTKREKALCRVQTAAVLRCAAVFADSHCTHAAADEYNEKAPGAPGTFSCSSTLLVSRSFLSSSHQHFKVFSPGISLPHTFAPFDALKPAPDREKCALSCIAQKISNILFLCFKSFSLHFI